MTNTKLTRGGKREGAGASKKGDNKLIQIPIYFPKYIDSFFTRESIREIASKAVEREYRRQTKLFRNVLNNENNVK